MESMWMQLNHMKQGLMDGRGRAGAGVRCRPLARACIVLGGGFMDAFALVKPTNSTM
jgi:hypothetical protein